MMLPSCLFASLCLTIFLLAQAYAGFPCRFAPAGANTRKEVA